MTDHPSALGSGYLFDVRVVELADEQGEYAGKVLAGLGADVVKIEPPGGNATRRIGPFLGGVEHPDRSLYFWHYNFGKRGATLDLGDESQRRRFLALLAEADVFLETTPRGYLSGLGISYAALKEANPGLVWVRLSPFGDDGPWADYKGSDLVHLALGGMMMNSGYDRDPLTQQYDTPPIAPQMFHAYHIAGQHAVIATIGALLYRHATGRGQYLSTAIHEAVSKNTEVDMPAWIYQRQPFYRQTCRHAAARPTPPNITAMKDGRFFMFRTNLNIPTGFANLLKLLERFGCADDLTDERYQDPAYRSMPEVQRHVNDVALRFVAQCSGEGPFHAAQQAGLVCAPLRRPEENLRDPHWATRETFYEIEHPELGRRFTYLGAPWLDTDVPWRKGPRAPMLDENNGVDGQPRQEATRFIVRAPGAGGAVQTSARGRPFALNNVRVIDFTWWLASGGGPRFLSALGAEVIKVEWKGRWDLRFMNAMPDGGRAERDRATAPCPPAITPAPGRSSPNHSGSFNEINPGKRGISLNMNHPKAKEILRRLIEVSDVVAEGFSPEVMRRWGFGYEAMRAINPSIIYVQQSGMGQKGTYGKYRATGPVAASLSGLSEMSGLPEPYLPAGIGYSYLDWFGAYNIATAMIAAIYRREKTGHGAYIDASQVECGISLTGSAILNFSANGVPWQRYGNRSPWKRAAPAGAYRC
ncbi:MAG: CoA transferase, partial [Dehalococcoidia bacterium]